jgi:hypothetical protein
VHNVSVGRVSWPIALKGQRIGCVIDDERK